MAEFDDPAAVAGADARWAHDGLTGKTRDLLEERVFLYAAVSDDRAQVVDGRLRNIYLGDSSQVYADVTPAAAACRLCPPRTPLTIYMVDDPRARVSRYGDGPGAKPGFDSWHVIGTLDGSRVFGDERASAYRLIERVGGSETTPAWFRRSRRALVRRTRAGAQIVGSEVGVPAGTGPRLFDAITEAGEMRGLGAHTEVAKWMAYGAMDDRLHAAGVPKDLRDSARRLVALAAVRQVWNPAGVNPLRSVVDLVSQGDVPTVDGDGRWRVWNNGKLVFPLHAVASAYLRQVTAEARTALTAIVERAPSIARRAAGPQRAGQSRRANTHRPFGGL